MAVDQSGTPGGSAPPTPTPRPGTPPVPPAPRKRATAPAAPQAGQPRNQAGQLSGRTGATAWGDPDSPLYQQQNIVTLDVNGIKFTVNKVIAPQMAGFLRDLIAAGYKPKSVQGYNNRAITGGSGKSNHAYGAAIDIDPGDNPRYVGSNGKHKIDDNVARSLAKKWGLYWGGDYKDSKDYMHFEALGAPRTPGSPAGGTQPVVTPAAAAVGAQGVAQPSGVSGRTAVPAAAVSSVPAVGAGPLPKNATPQQIHDEVARSYGYLAAFLNDKEIGPILTRAAIEDWDEAKLTGALTATKWWKTTSDSTRQWDALNKLDPAKAKSQLDQQMAQMRDLAEQQGIVLTGLQLHDISVNSLRFGWNAAQTKDALLQQGKHDPRADTARKYDQLLTEDPASAQKLLDDAVRDVQSRAAQLGVVVSTDQARNLGQQALRGAWDASRTVDELLRVGTRSTDPNAAGAVQTGAGSLREMASSYLVPLSDQTLNAWSERIARGQGTANDFQTYLKDQAKILRPWMSKQIDAGLTVAQYADPFRQIAARELEISPEDVDLSSPRYSRFIDGTVDKDGNRKPMSLADVQTYVRTLPEWSYTKTAHVQAADLTQSILGTFGKIA